MSGSSMSGSSMSRSVADPGKRFVAFLIDVAPIVALEIFGGLVSSGAIAGLVALAVLAYSIYTALLRQQHLIRPLGIFKRFFRFLC